MGELRDRSCAHRVDPVAHRRSWRQRTVGADDADDQNSHRSHGRFAGSAAEFGHRTDKRLTARRSNDTNTRTPVSSDANRSIERPVTRCDELLRRRAADAITAANVRVSFACKRSKDDCFARKAALGLNYGF